MALIKDLIIRGDDEAWTIALTDPAGLPLPLRNVQIQIVAKPPGSDLANDSDALYRHTATFAADGTLTNAVGIRVDGSVNAGIITEFLTPVDIAALATAYDAMAGKDPRILALWDVQVRDALGRHKTVLTGQLSMVRDIGRVRDIA